MLVTEEFSVSFLETFSAVVSQDLGSDIIRVSDILAWLLAWVWVPRFISFQF